MNCTGTVTAQTVASPPIPALSAFISKRKWSYCSTFQHVVDAMCKFVNSGNIGRYYPAENRWICLDAADVSLEGHSFCANNCGGIMRCAGGIAAGESPSHSGYIIQQQDIVEAFAALRPCKQREETCVPSSMNPPTCLTTRRIIATQIVSRQQEAMDKYCQTQMDQLCREGKWKIHCYQLWLSRIDTGGNSLSSPEWTCYPVGLLDFSRLSFCADGCSNKVPCQGAPTAIGSSVTAFLQLSLIASDKAFCSPYQKAANDYCIKKNGEGWVARGNVDTASWACFRAVINDTSGIIQAWR
ncbi:putative microneme protein [Besnoitia besnoiti]|uniref:Putative microneme protein n=1 Tax=Besnoitia besnoiti TaxID=94643 RepID=A0A2A9M8U6_BESBE|nr:putative microneme protein [Besnoitia besnoiti]PFH31812.1 putative microneme protein [Besnoitia besnoiti]